jgi:uncharacterized protein YjbI with pentapeptide repeats
MTLRNMLYQLLRFLVGEEHINYSQSTNGGRSGPRRLSREDVIRFVQANGGSSGLDISGADLSGANLENLDLQGIILGHYDPRLPRTNLEGTRLVRTNLRGAKLLRANFERAHMYLSNLQEADLRWANLSQANLYGADLRGANLYRSKLIGTDLWEARLEGADLYLAFFDDHTHLSRQSLGEQLLQEDLKLYRLFIERNVVPTSRHELETHLQDRYFKASEIYLRLKSAFLGAGRYEDASWSYFKQRQTTRRASAPWHAKGNYGRWYLSNTSTFWKSVWFYLKYARRWLLDCGAEFTCGYGERPLRTLICAVIIVLIFPLLFVWSGGITSVSGAMSPLDLFNYSFAAFTTMGFNQFEATTPLAQTLTSIESLLGISVLALVMFTLGNRISRS